MNLNEVADMIRENMPAPQAALAIKAMNDCLEDAYRSFSDELARAEEIAENGYREAFGIIQDLRATLKDAPDHNLDSLVESWKEYVKK